MKDHTYLVREGRWQIAGSTIDVAGNANVVVGFAIVTHDGSSWKIEEQVNETVTRYVVARPENGAAATSYRGNNSAIGDMRGDFAFFDDLILSTYRSDDGRYAGCEAIRRTDDAHYETRGALFLDGGHVSSWSYVMELRAP